MLQMMSKNYLFLHNNPKMLFWKFHSTQKNMSVIFAPKQTSFTDFYGKLFKNFYEERVGNLGPFFSFHFLGK